VQKHPVYRLALAPAAKRLAAALAVVHHERFYQFPQGREVPGARWLFQRTFYVHKNPF
jgi:hypothetical protein